MTDSTDPRIDAYIDNARPFAQPILRHLRGLVHEAVPDVTETTKWGMPFFEHRGVLCGMASFKQHATFTIWKASLIPEIASHLADQQDKAMGTFGRVERIDDLPPKATLIDWLRRAADLNERNIKAPRRAPAPNRQDVAPPDDLVAALEQDEAARLAFERFPPSHRREYIEWIEEAKTDATRQKRLETAIAWMAEGKSRHWKYQKR